MLGEIISLPSLKGHWPLNGNSNDSSGNGMNGTDNNITYIKGKFGQSADGNGTDSYISIADNANNSPTGAFSISLWLTQNNALPDNYNDHLVNKWQSGVNSDNSFSLNLLRREPTTPYRINFAVSDNGVYNAANDKNFFLNSAPSLNVAHHVMAVFNPVTPSLEVFLDGCSLGGPQTISATSIHNSSRNLILGEYNNLTNNRPLDGQLEDVVICFSDLAARDARRIYGHGTGKWLVC